MPNEDRLTYSVIVEITPQGKIINHKIGKSIICSKRRYNYDEVQQIIDDKQGDNFNYDKRPDRLAQLFKGNIADAAGHEQACAHRWRHHGQIEWEHHDNAEVNRVDSQIIDRDGMENRPQNNQSRRNIHEHPNNQHEDKNEQQDPVGVIADA